jgi:hypothetical protein
MKQSECFDVTKLWKLDDHLIFLSVIEQIIHEEIAFELIFVGFKRKILLVCFNLNGKIAVILSFMFLQFSLQFLFAIKHDFLKLADALY